MSNNTIQSHDITVTIDQKSSVISYAYVRIEPDIGARLLDHLAQCLQRHAPIPGFKVGNVPIAYVKDYFQSDLQQYTCELLLKLLGINSLFQFLRTNKHIIATPPRLFDIEFGNEGAAAFTFELSKFDPPFLSEWRYLPFKAPGRKHYKDIDRQVESFIVQEKENAKRHRHDSIAYGDWIAFTVDIFNTTGDSLSHNNPQQFWLLTGQEEADKPLTSLFIEKNIGETITTNSTAVREFFGDNAYSELIFVLTIIDVLPCSYFDLDLFKRHFRLKTNKQMQEKMIEVFSYRNDLSQRRTMAEQSLKTVLSRHKIVPPCHAVLHKQSDIWNRVRTNPDYYVYRAQNDFEWSMKKLARKQVCEQLLLEQVAYSENLNMNNTDVKGLLNLINHPRMKEFIYFDLPDFRDNAVLQPIADEQLKHLCLKEKALNHIIYHLTQA